MNKRNKVPQFRTEERKNRIKNVLEKRQLDFTAVFENINDPHNLSACLRTCDAVGIYKVHLIYHSGQPFPKLGRESSASAKKWVETVRYDSVEDCFTELKKENFDIFTTHMSSDSTPLYNLNAKRKIALVFGNEHSGISKKALELADGNFLIPQVGMIQSLNISVACAVSLYEIFRQKQNNGSYDINHFGDKFESVLDEWLAK